MFNIFGRNVYAIDFNTFYRLNASVCETIPLVSIIILIFVISLPNLQRRARYRRDTYLGVGGHI